MTEDAQRDVERLRSDVESPQDHEAASGSPDHAPPDAEASSRRYQADLLRGTVINTIGFVGKILQPLAFVVVTWALGPATTGVFLLVTFIADVFRGAVVDGYADAVTVVASRELMSADPDAGFRGTTAAAMRSTTVVSALAIPFALVLGPFLGHSAFAEHVGFADALAWTAYGLPFTAFATIALAATKARFKMHYQVILMNFARPAGVLVSSIVASVLGKGLIGLMVGVLLTDVLVAVGALIALTKEIGRSPLTLSFLGSKAPDGLHSLAIPQSANLTANRYLTRLDAIMLAAMGLTSAQVAFYSTGALITSALREAKLAFSGALAPVISRHHGQGETEAISLLLGRVSRWTGSIVAPLVFAVITFRSDLVLLVNASYTDDTLFMVALLLPPYLACSIGLAGNTIFYTGHSRWNLANSLFIATTNTVLNLVLIPSHGILGAALATAIASILQGIADLLELRYLERIVIPWRSIRPLHLAFLAGFAPLLLIGDPAALPHLGQRILAFLAMALVAGIAAFSLGHEELRAFVRRHVPAPKR